MEYLPRGLLRLWMFSVLVFTELDLIFNLSVTLLARVMPDSAEALTHKVEMHIFT